MPRGVAGSTTNTCFVPSLPAYKYPASGPVKGQATVAQFSPSIFLVRFWGNRGLLSPLSSRALILDLSTDRQRRQRRRSPTCPVTRTFLVLAVL